MSIKIDDLARFNPNLPGFKIRRNEKNRFAVVELDYYADPLKRSPEWIKAERARISPKQWAVEYERSWESWAGKPVYEGVYFEQLHVLPKRIEPDPNYPIFRGFDFGGNQSAAICQIINGRLYVLDELPNGGLNTETFMPIVISFCNASYGESFHYIDIIDPSAMWDSTRARNDSACADVMRELGLKPVPAPTNDPKKRIGAVIKLLRTLGSDGKPNLQINPNCTMIIKGMAGGYHYPEKATQSRKQDQPVKNLFSHIADALQYVAVRLESYERDKSERAQYEHAMTRTPKYSFLIGRK